MNLHLAEWFLVTRIMAFSMSKNQIAAIRAKAAKRNLSNVVLVVGDMATYKFNPGAFGGR